MIQDTDALASREQLLAELHELRTKLNCTPIVRKKATASAHRDKAEQEQLLDTERNARSEAELVERLKD